MGSADGASWELTLTLTLTLNLSLNLTLKLTLPLLLTLHPHEPSFQPSRENKGLSSLLP